MKLNSLSTLALALVLAAGVVGCKKKMDRVTPLPGYGADSSIRDGSSDNPIGTGLRPGGIDVPGPVTPGPGPGPGDLVPLTGKRSIEGRSQDREKYRSQTVYFDFDKATVKASEISRVQEAANKFKAEDAATDLLIEGHCDERGTEGYNQSLGERRALAIRESLVSFGVPADRIHTVSFGKDKPAELDHTEAAWGRNRRGEFILVLPK